MLAQRPVSASCFEAMKIPMNRRSFLRSSATGLAAFNIIPHAISAPPGNKLNLGFVGPMGASLKARADAETKYYVCIKAGLLAYMQGYSPAVAIEFARKTLYAHERPSFYEVEDAVATQPAT